jgi:hypothetical protein
MIADRIDSFDLGGDPSLDSREEVDPVGRAAAGVGMGQGLAGGRAERPEDVALTAPTVVDLLLGPWGRPGRGLDLRLYLRGAVAQRMRLCDRGRDFRLGACGGDIRSRLGRDDLRLGRGADELLAREALG